MITVYPDTNALHNNVALSNDSGRRLAHELTSNGDKLQLSPVVLAEMQRRELGEADAAGAQMTSVVTRTLRGSPVDGTAMDLRSSIAHKYTDVLSRPYVELDDWPEVSAQEVTERELDRRRPFLDIPDHGTIGHRDAMIWEGVLQAARILEDGDALIFVSGDKGFWDDKNENLHPDLVKDLSTDPEIVRSRVHIEKDLYRARILMRELREELTNRQARVASAMVGLVTSLDTSAIGWHHDAQVGDFVQGNYPLVEVPRDLEEAKVVAVDLEGDPRMSVLNGRDYKVYQDAIFTIEGDMRLDSWLLDEGSEVEIWGDINEYYVSAAIERRVTVEADIEFGDEYEEPDVLNYEVYMASGRPEG
jgi:hypothetical protein